MFITVCGAGVVGNSAMKTWLEGLCLWHTINDTPWHGDNLLHCTLKVHPPSLKQLSNLNINQGASKITYIPAKPTGTLLLLNTCELSETILTS